MLTSAPPRKMIAAPSRISSPPRVTMNDGILSRATRDPWMVPTAEQASNAAMIATHHGQLGPVGCTSSATTTLPNAMTRPTERSISPRSRAKISAIASTMYTALCSNRLTKFCGDRNVGFAIWKLTATTTMARTTGRTPLSPLRTRSHQARRYWPSDWARSSGGTSAAAASGAAVRSVATAAAEEADPADDGGSHRVQDELAGVCRIGAVLTEEKGAEQDAAQAGGRRAQREGPGADAGDADAGAAGRFGVATDGVDVAAEAGPLEQERQDAKDDQDDRDHPRNSLHRHKGSPAVDTADQH